MKGVSSHDVISSGNVQYISKIIQNVKMMTATFFNRNLDERKAEYFIEES